MPSVERLRCGSHRVEELDRIDKIAVVAGLATEMFSSQGEAQVARKDACAIAKATRISGFALVAIVIDDGTAELGIVRPRAAIQIVAAYAGPYVVDDTDLGMHVDRHTLVVLDPIHSDAVAASRPQLPQRV